MKKRFKRQEWWKKIRFKREIKWRKPRGRKNPMRRRVKGKPPMPRIGYRKPRRIRGLHPSGFIEVLVSNVKELENLDKEKHIVRIRKGVGKRKRMLIIEKAKKMGLKVVQSGLENAEEAGK